MLELGAQAASLHREIGRFAAGCVDALVVLGEHADEVVAGAREAGLAAERAQKAEDHAAAVATLQPRLQTGARILVKGSRGMRMEKACQILMERLGNGGGH